MSTTKYIAIDPSICFSIKNSDILAKMGQKPCRIFSSVRIFMIYETPFLPVILSIMFHKRFKDIFH
ncbi:MAG TPA: hypothetical protein VIK72_05460 [Clostridiaceae bacterium]